MNARLMHAVLFLGGWALIGAVFGGVLFAIVGCSTAPNTHVFVVPETAFVLMDSRELVGRGCGPNGTNVNADGCFVPHPRIVYCLRAEARACVTEWLHAAGLDHAQIREEGF